MTRKLPRARATRVEASAFTAAAIAILAVGFSGSIASTSAFSPILPTSPRATTSKMQAFPMSPMATAPKYDSDLLRLRMSNVENDDEEESNSFVATLTRDEAEAETARTPLEIEKSTNSSANNPTPVLVSMLQNLWNGDGDNENNKKPSQQSPRGLPWAAAVAAFCLAFLPLTDADAAMSGGRMGGSFQAAPMRSAVPMRSSSYSRGFSAGYRSRPSVTVAPSFGYHYGGYNPFYSPFYSPFAGPRFFGGGPAGILSVPFRGPSFFDLVFWGGLFFAVSQVLSETSPFETDGSDFSLQEASSPLGPGTSVVSLSVALEVPDRDDKNSILSALDKLSRTARTDSRVGIQNLSSQVALEILRRRSSILSASSSTRHFSKRDRALREFQKLSVAERSKFETETVSKFGGVDYSSPVSSRLLMGGDEDKKGSKATMAVITLVLAIDGDSTKLNKIRSPSDVEQALQKIASDSMVGDCLQSAEILWTPEDRTETLSVRDVIADYPELRSI